MRKLIHTDPNFWANENVHARHLYTPFIGTPQHTVTPPKLPSPRRYSPERGRRPDNLGPTPNTTPWQTPLSNRPPANFKDGDIVELKDTGSGYYHAKHVRWDDASGAWKMDLADPQTGASLADKVSVPMSDYRSYNWEASSEDNAIPDEDNANPGEAGSGAALG